MLQPIDARVVVSKATKQERTESGIILPDTVSEQGATEQGEVLAVGPGSRSFSGELMPMDVKVGDTIIYQKFGGTEITHNGEEVILLAEKDILAIVIDKQERGF
jgi:chaperonin GroES